MLVIKGTQGVKANLAYKEGKFLPEAYKEELRKNADRSSVELRAKNSIEGQAECKICCE